MTPSKYLSGLLSIILSCDSKDIRSYEIKKRPEF